MLNSALMAIASGPYRDAVELSLVDAAADFFTVNGKFVRRTNAQANALAANFDEG